MLMKLPFGMLEMLLGIYLEPWFPKVCLCVFTFFDMLHAIYSLFGFSKSQGNYISFRQSTQKILAASWCLVAFVFVNIYSSTLTSYMSVTYQRPTINSFYDLAFNPSYKATVRIGSIQEIDLLVSRTESATIFNPYFGNFLIHTFYFHFT
jgi:hypothetical protein